MTRRPPRSTRVRSSAASDVYKRQPYNYASNVLITMPYPLVFDDFSRPLWVPDDTGHLHRAGFQKAAGGPVAALNKAHALELTNVVLRDGNLCVKPKTTAKVTF